MTRRLRGYPSEAELWAKPARSWAVWERICGISQNTLAQHFYRRGWKRNGNARGSTLTHAPCAECSSSLRLIELSSDRICIECEPDPVRRLTRREAAAFRERHPEYANHR